MMDASSILESVDTHAQSDDHMTRTWRKVCCATTKSAHTLFSWDEIKSVSGKDDIEGCLSRASPNREDDQ